MLTGFRFKYLVGRWVHGGGNKDSQRWVDGFPIDEEWFVQVRLLELGFLIINDPYARKRRTDECGDDDGYNRALAEEVSGSCAKVEYSCAPETKDGLSVPDVSPETRKETNKRQRTSKRSCIK